MAADLTGQRALVTGAAVRLGRAIALALARAGADVVIHYNQSGDEAQRTADDIRTLGRNAWLVQGPLNTAFDARNVFGRACTDAGPLNLLVNSASVFPSDNLRTLDEAATHYVLDTNALAPLALVRAFVDQGGSCIINLLDTAIREYDREHFSYHLAKRMLHTITRAAALEYAPGVRINAVAPGAVLPPPGMEDSYLSGRGDQTPLQAYADAQHVAEAVLFLARSTFITGEIIHVDGGRHLLGNLYD